MSSELIYTFNASAIALGGVVNVPYRRVIPSLASVALAPTGGLGSTVVTSYSRDGVMFDTAYSSVRGEMIAEDVYSTVAEVAIDNLTIFDTLHVDALRASVRSRRDLVNGGDDAEITFHAEYTGLVVDGIDIAPELDLELFEQCNTYAKFLDEVTEDDPQRAGIKKAKNHYRDRFEWENDTPSPAAPAMPLRASVAKPKLPQRAGYKLSIPRFGKVRLGEVVLKPGRRRLSLLQIDFNKKEGQTISDENAGIPATQPFEQFQQLFQLFGKSAGSGGGGSTSNSFPDSGTMTIASVEGNGTPIWPRSI